MKAHFYFLFNKIHVSCVPVLDLLLFQTVGLTGHIDESKDTPYNLVLFFERKCRLIIAQARINV